MVDFTGELPSALRANARWRRLGAAGVPAMLVHPAWEQGPPAPAPGPPGAGEGPRGLVLWMHGRTVNKELDPGRYLRWMRAGIATCAVDLPGHGQRFDAELQQPQNTLRVVEQMADEIDGVIEALADFDDFGFDRAGVGGMSAGAMAAILRLTRPHPFHCASVEATSGSWQHQRHRPMFRDVPEQSLRAMDPMDNLKNWREIPFQAIHARHDEWVACEGQAAFIEALRRRYRDPSLIEFIVYERTGAPSEHAGFGRKAANAKDRQRAFFRRWLMEA